MQDNRQNLTLSDFSEPTSPQIPPSPSSDISYNSPKKEAPLHYIIHQHQTIYLDPTSEHSMMNKLTQLYQESQEKIQIMHKKYQSQLNNLFMKFKNELCNLTETSLGELDLLKTETNKEICDFHQRTIDNKNLKRKKEEKQQNLNKIKLGDEQQKLPNLDELKGEKQNREEKKQKRQEEYDTIITKPFIQLCHPDIKQKISSLEQKEKRLFDVTIQVDKLEKITKNVKHDTTIETQNPINILNTVEAADHFKDPYPTLQDKRNACLHMKELIETNKLSEKEQIEAVKKISNSKQNLDILLNSDALVPADKAEAISYHNTLRMLLETMLLFNGNLAPHRKDLTTPYISTLDIELELVYIKYGYDH